MRRAYFLILVVFGISTATFAQVLPSDSQTLQALLIEVRELRQGLLSSLARVPSAQILLSRLQTQQAAVLRASDRLNDARLRLAHVQTHQEDVRNNLKRLEDALSAKENPVRRKELREMINHSKSELEDSTDLDSARRQKSKPSSSFEPNRTNSPCSRADWTNLSESWTIQSSNPAAACIKSPS